MTTIYDPRDDRYVDEADVRGEMTRVFDICGGCRACSELCASFPSLFEMLDRMRAPDAGLMTPAQQDRVVAQCHGCTSCVVQCPFAPGRDDADVDVPRLMLRARAMAHRNAIPSIRDHATTQVMARTDRVGRWAVRMPFTDRIVSAAPGSVVRRLLSRLTGVSAGRTLPTFARQRFSTWFSRRPKVTMTRPRASVTVLPTCVVEYQAPAIGQDLVKVYERNGIECAIAQTRCCGAPWLYAGDIDRFAKVAAGNVGVLADEVRRGRDVVVADPTCSSVIEHDYPDHVPGADTELVAEHTFDAAEYLMRLHAAGRGSLDTDFRGGVSTTSITYHAPCHLRAQNIGLPSRDLMALTGAIVRVVQQCAGSEVMWGLRAGNDRLGDELAGRLGATIDDLGGDVVVGDSHLANVAITEQTGREVTHPLQLLARAYGIAEEP